MNSASFAWWVVAEKLTGVSKPVLVLIDDSNFNGGEYHDRDEGQPHSANTVHVGWTALGPCSTYTGLSTGLFFG